MAATKEGLAYCYSEPLGNGDVYFHAAGRCGEEESWLTRPSKAEINAERRRLTRLVTEPPVEDEEEDEVMS